MNEHKGWIKLHRKTLDNPACMKDAECFAVWCWLLLNASYTPETQWFKGEKIELKEGQILTTLDEISRALRIKQSKVVRIINLLKNEKQIEKQTSNRNTLISVVNWEKFQSSEKQNGKLAKTERKTSEKLAENLPIIKENNNIRIKEYKKSVSEETVCQTETVRRIVDRWNLLKSKGVKPIRKLSNTSKRYGNLVARINEYSEEEVMQAIDNIESSEFLRGRNSQGWCICFDWFVLPNNFHKVLEGNYENRARKDKFNNYNGRSYDMNALERRLVQ